MLIILRCCDEIFVLSSIGNVLDFLKYNIFTYRYLSKDFNAGIECRQDSLSNVNIEYGLNVYISRKVHWRSQDAIKRYATIHTTTDTRREKEKKGEAKGRKEKKGRK